MVSKEWTTYLQVSAYCGAYQNMLLGFVKSNGKNGKIKFTASNHFYQQYCTLPVGIPVSEIF